MASPVATDQFGSNYKVEVWDHDPGATTAVIVSPDGGTTKKSFDMRDFENFVVMANNSVLTGDGIEKLEIVAASDSLMADDLTVIKDSGTIAVATINDWAMLECTADELAQLSSDGGISPALRYVAGRLTVDNSADEAKVVYIGYGGLHQDNLTPATTIE
jgi:hypothetical protein